MTQLGSNNANQRSRTTQKIELQDYWNAYNHTPYNRDLQRPCTLKLDCRHLQTSTTYKDCSRIGKHSCVWNGRDNRKKRMDLCQQLIADTASDPLCEKSSDDVWDKVDTNGDLNLQQQASIDAFRTTDQNKPIVGP